MHLYCGDYCENEAEGFQGAGNWYGKNSVHHFTESELISGNVPLQIWYGLQVHRVYKWTYQ